MRHWLLVVGGLLVGACGTTPLGTSVQLGAEGDGCGPDHPCGTGLYCDYAGGCGETAPGTCRERPQACTREYAPVCGCDGQTYGNACSANAAGIDVRAQGTCDKRCGGLLGLTCGADEWCDYENGSCGSGDQQGVCKPRPEACTLEYAPVCGCDGHTYSNACTASSAGVDVQHTGACTAGGG